MTPLHANDGHSNADRPLAPTERRVVPAPTPDLTDWRREHDTEAEVDLYVWRCGFSVIVDGAAQPCPHTFRLALDAPVATQGMMTRLVADHLREHEGG